MYKFDEDYDSSDDPNSINYVSRTEIRESYSNSSATASIVIGILITSVMVLIYNFSLLSHNLLFSGFIFIVSSLVFSAVAYLLIPLLGNFILGPLKRLVGFKIAYIIVTVLLSLFFIYRIFIIKG
ncbi:MAG: hypothetical protein ACK5L6_03740 [Anaerorhabdus sp.]|uniref:hypothetical protein n=1 Tax=Anaerorhabdus sp. TaxID=1872524 RepID=UPI003A87FE07